MSEPTEPERLRAEHLNMNRAICPCCHWVYAPVSSGLFVNHYPRGAGPSNSALCAGGGTAVDIIGGNMEMGTALEQICKTLEFKGSAAEIASKVAALSTAAATADKLRESLVASDTDREKLMSESATLRSKSEADLKTGMMMAQELSALRREVEELKRENVELRSWIEGGNATIERRTADRDRLHAENEKLKAALSEMERAFKDSRCACEFEQPTEDCDYCKSRASALTEARSALGAAAPEGAKE